MLALGPAAAQASCESILSFTVGRFAVDEQETLPTEVFEENLTEAQKDSTLELYLADHFDMLAENLSRGMACLERFRSDPTLVAINDTLAFGLRPSGEGLDWELDMKFTPRLAAVSDSVLAIFRAVRADSSARILSICLASFKASPASIAERDRLAPRLVHRRRPPLDAPLSYENCSFGGDPDRVFVLGPQPSGVARWGVYLGLFTTGRTPRDGRSAACIPSRGAIITSIPLSGAVLRTAVTGTDVTERDE